GTPRILSDWCQRWHGGHGGKPELLLTDCLINKRDGGCKQKHAERDGAHTIRPFTRTCVQGLPSRVIAEVPKTSAKEQCRKSPGDHAVVRQCGARTRTGNAGMIERLFDEQIAADGQGRSDKKVHCPSGRASARALRDILERATPARDAHV